MKYYKLSMDMERENDIICHFQNDYGIQQNALNTGKVFENWDDRFEFFYTKEEGDVWTDYLANDKGWFLISNRLKTLLESVNTDIQFLKKSLRAASHGPYRRIGGGHGHRAGPQGPGDILLVGDEPAGNHRLACHRPHPADDLGHDTWQHLDQI